ncbi:MAG TPA: hypothetical protein VNE58_08545 [Casimicrobiaceae bacterium]|nr:hypothetical protein [Casimicrobiaceae bacterium]
MQWIILEIAIALLLGLGIVWWTLSPARKRDQAEEKRERDARDASTTDDDDQ